MVDIGGGSTEFALGDSDAPEKVISCEIGAVRLTETVPALAGRDGAIDAQTVSRAAGMARDALRPIAEYGSIEHLALVGGSATTTAAIVRGRGGPVPSFRLTRADLKRTLDRLLEMPLAERKKVAGMKAQRADILPAGILVIDAALETLGRDEAIATTSDLLLGILLQERDAAGQQQRLPGGSETRRGFRG